MSTESNKEIVRRFIAGRWDHDRLASFCELLSDDYAYHGPMGELRGAKEYCAAYRKRLEAISDLHVRVDALIAEGDLVAARFQSSFVHRGEILRTFPTGKEILVDGLSVHRVADGKVAETWITYDRLKSLVDMGGAQRLSEADDDAIRKIIHSVYLVGSGNRDARGTIYARDAEVMPAGRPSIWGIDAIHKWLDGMPELSEWKLTDVEIDGAGDFAYARGNYSIIISPRGERPYHDTGKYIQIWRKQEAGDWKVTREIFDSDAPVTATAPNPDLVRS